LHYTDVVYDVCNFEKISEDVILNVFIIEIILNGQDKNQQLNVLPTFNLDPALRDVKAKLQVFLPQRRFVVERRMSIYMCTLWNIFWCNEYLA
jgi:hypothetical protein